MNYSDFTQVDGSSGMDMEHKDSRFLTEQRRELKWPRDKRGLPTSSQLLSLIGSIFLKLKIFVKKKKKTYRRNSKHFWKLMWRIKSFLTVDISCVCSRYCACVLAKTEKKTQNPPLNKNYRA